MYKIRTRSRTVKQYLHQLKKSKLWKSLRNLESLLEWEWHSVTNMCLRNIVSPPKQVSVAWLLKSYQAFIFFWSPLYENVGLKVVPKGGWYCAGFLTNVSRKGLHTWQGQQNNIKGEVGHIFGKRGDTEGVILGDNPCTLSWIKRFSTNKVFQRILDCLIENVCYRQNVW